MVELKRTINEERVYIDNFFLILFSSNLILNICIKKNKWRRKNNRLCGFSFVKWHKVSNDTHIHTHTHTAVIDICQKKEHWTIERTIRFGLTECQFSWAKCWSFFFFFGRNSLAHFRVEGIKDFVQTKKKENHNECFSVSKFVFWIIVNNPIQLNCVYI